MDSLLFLAAVLANCIIDYFVYRKLSEAKTEYEIIRTETIKFNHVVKSIAEHTPELLQQHAAATAKAVSGVIGYYQGKGQKDAAGNIDGVNEIVDKLGPLGDILKAAQQGQGPNGGAGGFHL